MATTTDPFIGNKVINILRSWTGEGLDEGRELVQQATEYVANANVELERRLSTEIEQLIDSVGIRGTVLEEITRQQMRDVAASTLEQHEGLREFLERLEWARQIVADIESELACLNMVCR